MRSCLVPARLLLPIAVMISLAFQAEAGGLRPFSEAPRGSADRRQILDLLRMPMQRVFAGRIEFAVSVMNVSDSDAFARVHPQRPGGAPLTIDFPCEVSGADLEIEATFVKRDGSWHYDSPADGEFPICADDVTSWDTWLRERGLPPDFVGRSEFLDGSQ